MNYNEMWIALGLPENNDIGNIIYDAYREPHRHYHTERHLRECMSLLNDNIHLFSRPAEVKLALYFHDIVYDPKSSTNEIESANYAVNFLGSIGASSELQQRIHELIMMTVNHKPSLDYDAQLMIDIDLAILGSIPSRFNEYQEQIRKEFSHVEDNTFKQARNEIMQKFLDRYMIFKTANFRNMFEIQARKNITKLIQETTYE